MSENVVKVAETTHDIARVAAFLGTMFPGAQEYVRDHPDVQPSGTCRYVEHAGEVVAGLVVEHMKLTFGAGEIRAGRLECVGTARGHRRRGLCRMLVEDAVQYLSRAGADIAIIFGEPLFRRMGFEYGIPTYAEGMPLFTPPGTHCASAVALKRAARDGTLCPLTDGMVPQLQELHAACNRSGNLSRLRSLAYWHYTIARFGAETYRMLRVGDQLGGYYRYEAAPGRLCVTELVSRDENACAQMLGEICERADSLGCSALTLHCPHNSVAGKYLAAHHAASFAPCAHRETTLQVRILNLPACLGKLTDRFAAALRRSELAGMSGRWTIATPTTAVTLVLASGAVHVLSEASSGSRITIADGAMAQLLAGFQCEQTMRSVAASDDGLRLMQILFPSPEPYWYVDDV